ncbi:hypothetical protein [Streptomyces sp. SLBN-134]|uniref:hypothetical protein n=1 Tax=Streptomyces sp. SLBN-134 TaxID=2768456 RepID=UPI00115141F0|nr:hypothetical protein [Streptomyces sp. SLBN-134]TQL21234.1 hypothetical protein FBY37_3211 [Streptomyces sp. SLBN-134]
MSDWKWDYNPSQEHLTGGLPVGVIAEVERIATELAALGRDAELAGSRPEDRPGGLRNFPLFGGRGFLQFLAVPGHECVYICNIVWMG